MAAVLAAEAAAEERAFPVLGGGRAGPAASRRGGAAALPGALPLRAAAGEPRAARGVRCAGPGRRAGPRLGWVRTQKAIAAPGRAAAAPS